MNSKLNALLFILLLISTSVFGQTAFEYNTKGLKYSKKKNYTEAMIYFNKAISVDPNYAPPYGNIGLIKKIDENYTDAIVYFDKSLALDSTGNEAYLNYMYKGQCYLELSKFDLAVNDFTKSLQLNPSNYSLYFDRGYANAMLENYSNVKNDFEIYLKHYPNNKMAQINLANVENLLGNTQYSLEMHNKLMQKYPNDYLLYNNRAEVYLVLKDYSKAMSDIDMAIKLKTRYAIGNFVKSKIYYKMNELDNACLYLKRALEYGLEPEDDKDFSEIQAHCNK